MSEGHISRTPDDSLTPEQGGDLKETVVRHLESLFFLSELISTSSLNYLNLTLG